MGINPIGMKHLLHCRKYGDFGKTIMLGRQKIMKHQPTFNGRRYSNWQTEDMLIGAFGSTDVDSLDYSDFEGANIIHDLNTIIEDENLLGQYDTVIDYGTTEHVFNVSNALLNASKLCKKGGQIIHHLPANQSCNHGFWQISPEVFQSLYTEYMGYKDTEIFMCDMKTGNYWEPAKRAKKRAEIVTENTVYIACRTVLNSDPLNIDHSNVQQYDYTKSWENA